MHTPPSHWKTNYTLAGFFPVSIGAHGKKKTNYAVWYANYNYGYVKH